MNLPGSRLLRDHHGRQPGRSQRGWRAASCGLGPGGWLGGTVGVLLSGIHAGAVSGWVFLLFCTVSTWSCLQVLRRLDQFQ